MEVTPAGGAIREHSSSVESSSSEEKKVIGGRQVIEKSSSFQAEESSKVVESSQSVQQSSSRLVQSSVSSVSSSQKTVSSSSTSLSSDLQSQGALDDNGNQMSEGLTGKVKVFSSQKDQESFTKKQDGQVVEQVSSSSQQESVTSEPAAPQPPNETPAFTPKQVPDESQGLQPESLLRACEVTSSVPHTTEINQESIKNTLKEIISEIEEAVVSELNEDTTTQVESSPSRTKRTLEKQTSTTTLEETNNVSDAGKPPPACPPLPPHLFTVDRTRPLSLTSDDLAHLFQSVQIAHELNQVLREEKQSSSELFQETQQMDDNQTSSDVPSKPIDLEKLFTPASDSGEITPSRNRKMYSSSSFYSSNLHPTLEDQVDLARKISHSLSDISNQQSKGQSMYVNRKKKSVKWIHEGTGTREIGDGSEAPGDKMSFKIPNIGPQEVKFRESSKPILKLVMDPRGQVQDLNSLRKQGYSIEPGAVSPEVVFDLVRDLNSPRGKGAELFAKRRKKSEKWVVDENTIRQTTSSSITTSEHLYSSSSTSLQRQLSGTTGSRQSAPVPTYHPDYTKRAEHTQKLMEIQERFSQPRIKMVKSPWEAALETGSVDTAFQELPPLINPTPNPPAWSSSSYSASTYETQNYSSAPETFTPAPLPSVQAYNPPAGVTAPRKPQYIPGGGKDFLYQAKPPRGWGIGQPQQQPTPGFKELNLSSSASTAANSLAEDFPTLASRPISSPSTFPVYIPFTPTSAQPQSSASGKVTSSTTQISVQKNVSFSATQQATTPEQPKSTFQASRQPITTQTPNRTLIQQTPKQTFPSNSVQKPDQSQIKHVITPNTAKPPAGKITAPQVPLEQTQPITQLESKLQEIANSAAAVDRVLSKETVSEVSQPETKTDTQKIDQVNEGVIKDGVDKILQGETEGVSQRMEEVNVQNILVSEQENKFSEIIESEQEILTQSYSQDEVKQECVSISNLGKTQAVEIKQEQPISSQVPQSEVENIEPPLLAEKSQPVQNKPDPTKPLPPSEVQQVIPTKPLPISKIPIVSTPTPFSILSTKQYGHVSPSRDQTNQQPTFQNTHTGVSFTEVFKNDDIKETVNLLIEPQPANQGMQRDHQTETKKVQKSSSSFRQNKVHPNITEQIAKINQNQQTLQNVTQTKFSKQQEFTQIIQQQENVVYESRPAVKSIIQNFEQSTRPPMKYKQIQQQSSIEEFMKQATSQQPPSDNPIYYVSNAKVETRTFLPSQEQISQSQTIEQHQQVSSTIQHFQKTEQTQWQSQSSSLITSSSQTQSISSSSAANQQLQAGARPASTHNVYQPPPPLPPAPTQTPAPHKLVYAELNNYNTAARGWGNIQDYYRPVTFQPTKVVVG